MLETPLGDDVGLRPEETAESDDVREVAVLEVMDFSRDAGDRSFKEAMLHEKVSQLIFEDCLSFTVGGPRSLAVHLEYLGADALIPQLLDSVLEEVYLGVLFFYLIS